MNSPQTVFQGTRWGPPGCQYKWWVEAWRAILPQCPPRPVWAPWAPSHSSEELYKTQTRVHSLALGAASICCRKKNSVSHIKHGKNSLHMAGRKDYVHVPSLGHDSDAFHFILFNLIKLYLCSPFYKSFVSCLYTQEQHGQGKSPLCLGWNLGQTHDSRS